MPVAPQSPPATTAFRAACTPQFTGLKRESCSIQCGICRRRDQDRREEHQRQADEVRGRDHRRLACGRAARSRARARRRPSRAARDAAKTTSQPSAPPCTRTPSASPTSSRISAWSTAMMPARTTCERMIAKRDAGRGEEAVDHVPVEVDDHRHARPAAAEERVHADDPRREELDVAVGAAAQRADAREELAVEQEPDQRLDHHQRDPDRLAHQVAQLPHDHPAGLAEQLLTASPASSSDAKSRPV